MVATIDWKEDLVKLSKKTKDEEALFHLCNETFAKLDAKRSGLSPESFDAALLSLSRPQLISLFSNVYNFVKAITDDPEFEQALENEQNMETEDDASPSTAEMRTKIHILRNICSLTQSCVNVTAAMTDETNLKKFPGYCMSTIEALHDIIFQLASPAGRQLQSAIIKLCLKVWTEKFENRETIVVQTVPALLVLSLDDETAKDADIRRVYEIREALNLFDMEDSSSDGLRELLMRCFVSPLYLRTKENRKFLEYCLQLDDTLLMELHQTIRMQLPMATKSHVQAYADLYFKAWSKADIQRRQSIETVCIQDLMERATLAAVPATFNVTRNVLNKFVQNKKQKGMDIMLTEMYTPILWRALEAPNAKVRRNGALLLLDVFPLGNAKGDKDQYGQLMQDQLFAITNLLTDNDADVRSSGVQGVCKIISLFWEILPVATIKTWLKHLVTESAFDASSPNVRQAVFEGLTYILDQVCAHDTMKQLLPTLGRCIHDKNDRVRLAFVELLLRVQNIRGIRFFDVVELDDILARLVLDASRSKISNGLVQLLCPSLLPEDQAGSEMISRVLQCMQRHPAAGLVFYSQAHEFVSLSSIVKVVLLLHKAIEKAIKRAEQTHSQRKRGRKTSEGNDATETISTLDARNIQLMVRLNQLIVVLWSSIKQRLQQKEYETLETKLNDTFGGDVLPIWLTSFAKFGLSSPTNTQQEQENLQEELQNAIVAIAGFLPSDTVSSLAESLHEQLVSLKVDTEEFANNCISAEAPRAMYSLVDTLVHWQGAIEFAKQCIQSLISSDRGHYLAIDTVASSKTHEGHTKAVKKGANKELQSDTSIQDLLVAWWSLERMICTESGRAQLLADDTFGIQLAQLLPQILNLLVQDVSDTSLETRKQQWTLTVSARVCCRFHLHMLSNIVSFDDTTLLQHIPSNVSDAYGGMMSEVLQWLALVAFPRLAVESTAPLHHAIANTVAYMADLCSIGIIPAIHEWENVLDACTSPVCEAILLAPHQSQLDDTETETIKVELSPVLPHILRLVSRAIAFGTTISQRDGTTAFNRLMSHMSDVFARIVHAVCTCELILTELQNNQNSEIISTIRMAFKAMLKLAEQINPQVQANLIKVLMTRLVNIPTPTKEPAKEPTMSSICIAMETVDLNQQKLEKLSSTQELALYYLCREVSHQLSNEPKNTTVQSQVVQWLSDTVSHSNSVQKLISTSYPTMLTTLETYLHNGNTIQASEINA